MNHAKTPPLSTTIQIIGIIHSCFREKFGIPRQPGLVPGAVATLELLPPFNRQEMVKGLDAFSHIWVHFLFHDCQVEGWRPTVRPPWLGGKKRVGVFASRSPHRPNHLGLSAVKLLGVRVTGGKVCLDIGGADLLDGTPVVDIKPYVPYSDLIEGASGGYSTAMQSLLPVKLTREVVAFCRDYQHQTGRDLAQLITEVVGLDPRPACQKGQDKELFGMLLWDINIRWRHDDGGCTVVEASWQDTEQGK